MAQQRAKGIQTGVMIAVIVVVLRYLPVTSNLFFFSLIDNYAYDVAFERRASQPPSDIVIVAIDDDSMLEDRLGRFPWQRDTYVKLLENLHGAKVVGFDVLFTEPDRHNPEADSRFAEAIQRHGRVVLAAYRRVRAKVSAEEGTEEGDIMPSYAPPAGGTGSLMPVQARNFTPPIPELAKAAAGIGYVDITPDSDGVYRRVAPLRAGYDRRVYPHFATEIARVVSGTTAEQIVARVPERQVMMAERPGYLNADGKMLINYCGPTGTIPRFSFWEVVSGQVSEDEFKGKIVLVGATAPGLYDIRNAPYRKHSRFFLGVETNANIVNSLLHMPPLRDSSRTVVWLLFAMILGSLAGWVVWSSGETIGPLVGALILVVIALPSFFVVFYLTYQVIPYGAIALATAVPVGLGIYERLGAERRMIRGQFASYVSEDVLAMLTQDPELIRSGTQREITLLFSDVRGSTSLAEQSIPEEWLAQLNEYMSQMTEAIFDYNGYLDKFMGDGIMAIWNAFGTDAKHAELAVRTGLAMLERLDVLNQEWQDAENRLPFGIGIGLHTGEAMLGDAGSDQRRQYTAIGDAVNTAARIEEMNKELGTTFIISETTAELVRDVFELREIGEVEVRGRSKTVRVFEVMGNKS